ncbi:unnamed protein product [Amoebophrya sp. A120]|nr:unnamed protein product [Amoebophrya sp. A120]|eukprot:GSA120T00009394001.1
MKGGEKCWQTTRHSGTELLRTQSRHGVNIIEIREKMNHVGIIFTTSPVCSPKRTRTLSPCITSSSDRRRLSPLVPQTKRPSRRQEPQPKRSNGLANKTKKGKC